MLWYNNPDAVQAIHDQIMREKRQLVHRRRLLKVIAGQDTEITPVV
jgi:hypothetical protein